MVIDVCYISMETQACVKNDEINDLKLFSAQTLTLARDYAAAVKKPFPEIDARILEEKDWPKDFYVFEGKGKEPSIVYMPLFNRKNCKGLLHKHTHTRAEFFFLISLKKN